MKRGTKTSHRLVVREYLPMAGSLLLWAAVALTCGPAAAARLLVAWLLIGAVRGLVAINLQLPVAIALREGRNIAPSAWRDVWIYEALAALLALGLIAWLALDVLPGLDPRIGPLLLISAIGLPARHVGPLMAYVGARGRETGVASAARGVGGALLAGLAIAADAGLPAFAAILAAREWIGLAALASALRLPVPLVADADRQVQDAFEWKLIAGASGRHGRKRITYRLVKMVLSSLLGPVGTALARTARGTNLLRRIELRPAHATRAAAGIAVVALLTAAVVVGHGATLPHLVVASALFRLACIGANTCFWSIIGGLDPLPLIDEEDDDD